MRALKISLLVFTLSIAISAQWYQQLSGTTANIQGVWFADSLNGWICGDSGTVLKTSNGGQNWEKQNSNVSVKLEDVFFWDLQTGWIVGDSGTVIHTTDGGNAWNAQQTTVNFPLSHIQFVTSLKGFVSGKDSESLLTEDGGLFWQIIPGDSTIISLIHYWNSEAIGTRWITNGVNSIQSFTGDGGLNWSIPIVVGFNVTDIGGYRYLNEIYYWSVGEQGSALWLIDDGQSYPTFPGQTGDTLDLHSVTIEREIISIRLWAVGQQGWIISSTDSGQTWQTITSGVSSDLNDISFPINKTGWAVGDSGIILHTTNGGVSFVDEENIDGIKAEFSLSQNFPNPFNPTTKIEFQIVEFGFVSIKVYDVLGNAIASLVNEEKPIGEYEVEFDGTGLPSGIYFYQLKAAGYIETKKMVLMK